jgi:hypothetical protein
MHVDSNPDPIIEPRPLALELPWALLSIMHSMTVVLLIWSICIKYFTREEDALMGYVMSYGLLVSVSWTLQLYSQANPLSHYPHPCPAPVCFSHM